MTEYRCRFGCGFTTAGRGSQARHESACHIDQTPTMLGAGTDDEERDRASEARHGAAYLRRHPHSRQWSRDTMHLAMTVIARGLDRQRPIPEAAFDWPIYRAALAPVVGAFARVHGISTAQAEPIVRGLAPRR